VEEGSDLIMGVKKILGGTEELASWISEHEGVFYKERTECSDALN
jgi:hypothetical protein